MRQPFQHYLRFSLIYVLAAFVLILLTRDNPLMVGEKIIMSSRVFLSIFSRAFWVMAIAVPVLWLYLGRAEFLRRIPVVALAIAGAVVMQASFTLVKTSMPYLVPFWADPMLARLDAALHFGHDPFMLVHDLAARFGGIVTDWMSFTYILAWTPFAFALPVIIAATETDTDRARRFLILHVLAWVLIGNVLALAGMSAGPVFYDRLIEGARFAELTAVIESSGIAATPIGRIQNNLWEIYATQGQAIGSGISAFPSVHVATATVTALYLAERWRWLAPVGVAYLAAILFYSVYTGYHYALDGYVSIAVVGGLWVWLRRPARAAQDGPAMVPAE